MSYTWGAIFLLLPILRRVGLQESKYSSVSSVQCGICASSVVEGGEATSQRTQWDWWPPSWNGKGLKATSCCRRELSDETSTFRGRIHRYQVLGCARKKLFGGGFRFLGLAYWQLAYRWSCYFWSWSRTAVNIKD